MLTRINVSNLNSGEGFGDNISILKKLEDKDGKAYPYVSGQMIRRAVKDTSTCFDLKIMPTDENGNPLFDKMIKDLPKSPTERLKRIINESEDSDIFGFMEPQGVRRWSIFKTTPFVSIEPYNDSNIDLLIRNQGFKPATKGKEEASERQAAMVKTELNVFNYLRGSMIIEYDRIGLFEDEVSGVKEQVIEDKEKKERYLKIIKGIRYMYGGAKTARLLDDLTPVFVVAAIQNAGTPIFLNAIEVKENTIRLDKMKEVLKDFDKIIERVYIGVRANTFDNEDEIKNLRGEKIKICSIGEVFDNLETI
jgi:CRISPR-associated protein Cst2